jgi:uncharacterized protein YutE (UPF0331/DUF86 family)
VSGRLYALEKNILKYRAFEMVLVLFYIEDLKSFILHSIDASDRVTGRTQRIPEGTKNRLPKAFKILVDDGVITQAESDEIQRLIEYRNEIGHRIQELTVDVGTSEIAKTMRDLKGVKYDHYARKKLKAFRKELPRRMQGRYVLSLSNREQMFEAAEATYEQEISRLSKRITEQVSERLRKIAQYAKGVAAESKGMASALERAVKKLRKLKKPSGPH